MEEADMYMLPKSRYLRRSNLVNKPSSQPKPTDQPVGHEARVKKELIAAGLRKSDLRSSEALYVLKMIHPKEHIGGAVFGHGPEGFAMLVATDRRVVYIDTKPMYINEDEVSYVVVSGVKYEHAGFWSTVTLHTKVKDYRLRTFNKVASQKFVNYIESRSVEQNTTGV